jgi:hypothetical protein
MIINPSLLPIDISPQIRLGGLPDQSRPYMGRPDQQDMSKYVLHTKTAVAYGGLYTSWNKKKTSNITDRPPVFILRHHFLQNIYEA